MNALISVILFPILSAAAGAGSDPHSYARPEQVLVRHLDLELKPDFDKKIISATATLRIERNDSEAALVLDTRELSLQSVLISEDGRIFEGAPHSLGKADPILGAPLTIELAPDSRFVRIVYKTTPKASGLQWLTPEQTAGKKHPFLFTQSQAIHARSWIPIQDSPGIRITYTATVKTPRSLKAVMSAGGNFQAAQTGPEFRFLMNKPIPAYLLALAVGDLSFGSLGPRTGVYAEPSVLSAAAKELEDAEAMMTAVEGLYGPYRWDRYDVLVLPPSFAYGGMENPMLTFVSPTIIAGDKSLVGVLAHELAHSWSGNLVTNAGWGDFWLNEGFTTYVEGRIIEAVYGGARAAMEDILGRQGLDEELQSLDERDELLRANLSGRDPDEGVTDVPYEKGALFLKTLEAAFGRERFDAFLRGYFDAHAFQSVTTDSFLEDLDTKLFALDPAAGAAVPVSQWMDKPGIPQGAPSAVSDAFALVEDAAARWLKGSIDDAGLKSASSGWNYHQWHHFLKRLPQKTPTPLLARLDKAFGFTAAGNAEIACEWLLVAIRSGYAPADARLRTFLSSVGRGKFVKPLYKELAKTPAGKKKAREIYAKAKAGYQIPVAAAVEKSLKN